MPTDGNHRNGRPRHRVVVTGMGAITPIGQSVDTYWDGLMAGRSGAAPIEEFDTSQFQTRFACTVKDFDPLSAADRKEARRLDRAELFTLAATTQAVRSGSAA